MASPGDRQEADGRAHKATTGSSPNGVANAFLAQLRGKQVSVQTDSAPEIFGILVAFDAYSLQLKCDGSTEAVLIFKGPGVIVYDRSV